MKALHRMALLMCLGACSACATATTVVRSTPAGVNVFIDGEAAGITPVKVRLKKESHRILLEKKGYTSVTDYLSIEEQDPGLLVLLLFPVYWVFADDFKYTFKPAYDFELRAVQDGVFHHDDPADQRRQAE